MEEEKAVETTGEDAAVAGVEPTTSQAPEVDPVAELEAVKAELAKERRDKENYRKGMLAAKGKLPPDEGEVPEDKLDALIEKKVQEKLAESKEAQAESRLNALVEKQARELKEAKLALKAKGASSAIAGGTGSGSGSAPNSAVKTSYWSEEQKAELRKKGWSDAKIERAAELAKNNAANAPLSRP